MPSPEKFKKSMKEFDLKDDVVSAINKGYEELMDKSPKEMKAAYFKQAVDVMEEKLDRETMIELMCENGCCKGGAREKRSKAFAKENAGLDLEGKLSKITEVPFMGTPELNSDGTITVHAVNFYDGEKFQCACTNYNGVKRDYSVSKDYCFCCAGHFRHHYELMLGLKLKAVQIVSSPLDSEGKSPCVIQFAIVK